MTDDYQPRDPVLSAGFWVEVQGVVVAAFTECSGLKAETEFETVKEGGRNDVVYRLPTRTTFSNITLKRGWTTSSDLWSWYADVIQGKIQPRDCSIVMCRMNGISLGTELARINIHQAYPVKWAGPDFRIDGAAAAFETIELAHMGFQIAVSPDPASQ
jgi:phage tail-like protein